MKNSLKNSFGLAQIPLMIVLLLMAVAVPLATKLVQQNADNRNMAAAPNRDPVKGGKSNPTAVPSKGGKSNPTAVPKLDCNYKGTNIANNTSECVGYLLGSVMVSCANGVDKVTQTWINHKGCPNVKVPTNLDCDYKGTNITNNTSKCVGYLLGSVMVSCTGGVSIVTQTWYNHKGCPNAREVPTIGASNGCSVPVGDYLDTRCNSNEVLECANNKWSVVEDCNAISGYSCVENAGEKGQANCVQTSAPTNAPTNQKDSCESGTTCQSYGGRSSCNAVGVYIESCTKSGTGRGNCCVPKNVGPTVVKNFDSCGTGWACEKKAGGTGCVNVGGEVDDCTNSGGVGGNCCVPKNIGEVPFGAVTSVPVGGSNSCMDNVNGVKGANGVYAYFTDEASARCMCSTWYETDAGNFRCGRKDTSTSCVEECPGTDGILRNCTGNTNQSECNLAGRKEICGTTQYCCPSVGGDWTKNLSKCNGIAGPTLPAGQYPYLNYQISFGGVMATAAQCVVDWPLQFIVLGGGESKVYTNVIPQDKFVQGNKLVFVGGLRLTGFTKTSGIAVFIKGPKHLQMKYGINGQSATYNKAGGEIVLTSSETSSPIYNFSNYPLAPGDVSGLTDGVPDGVINGIDFAYIKPLALVHQEPPSGTKYLEADLDGNCQVGPNDLVWVKRSLEEKQGQLY